MCSLCCVRTQTSSIGSGCSNSDTWNEIAKKALTAQSVKFVQIDDKFQVEAL